MNRFSSFVLKTSSHQGWWFDGLTWLSRPEVHTIRCERLCKSLSKWPTGKQRTGIVSRCRIKRLRWRFFNWNCAGSIAIMPFYPAASGGLREERDPFDHFPTNSRGRDSPCRDFFQFLYS